MSEYTPTTEAVRGRIIQRGAGWGFYGLDEFDRWLAAHDAEVREEANWIIARIVSAANKGPLEGEDGFIWGYQMAVGPIHAAIPFLQKQGIVVTTSGEINKAGGMSQHKVQHSMACDACGALTFNSARFGEAHEAKADGRGCPGLFTTPRKDVEPQGEPSDALTIPRPHVPFGPHGIPEHKTDADYLDHAAKNLEGHYEVGGSNVRATVVRLLRDTAVALRAAGGEGR